MFLRIVDVYLIFEHFQWKPKPIAIKINIDLEATSVKKKIYIYMAYFHPLWIKHTMAPYYPQRKQNQWDNDEP